MARWEEALDAQLELYLYSTSEGGRTYATGWAKSVGTKNPTEVAALVNLPDRITATAFNADTFYVDPDMQTLWEAATPSFEPEPLQPQDLLAETGFVYLPRPFEWTDVHGKMTSIRALAWHESDITFETDSTKVLPGLYMTDSPTPKPKLVKGRGVVLMTFHRVGDKDDYDAGYGAWLDGPYLDREGPHKAHAKADANGVTPWKNLGIPIGALQIDHTMPWVYGGRYDDTYDKIVYHPSKHPLSAQKFAQCLWRLMQQTIATRNDERPGGQFRRRAERAKMYERKVTVIKLRRPRRDPDDDSEPREVEWTHRWLVSGHWRNQPYPTLGAGVTRQIWISPYLKGDPSLPLDLRKARVFELVR